MLLTLSAFDGFDLPCPLFAKAAIDLRQTAVREHFRMQPRPKRWLPYPFLTHSKGQTLRFGDVVLVAFGESGQQMVLPATVKACVPFIGVFIAARDSQVDVDVLAYVDKHLVPKVLCLSMRTPTFAPAGTFVAPEYAVLAVRRGPHWAHSKSRRNR